MPIPLGILAQFRQAAAGDFVLLESQVLSSNQSSVTFSGLGAYASQYRHLQVRAVVRTSRADIADTMIMRVNGNSSSSSYRSHALVGTGSSVVSEDYSTLSGIFAGQPTSANATANAFDAVVLDLLDPFDASKNKTVRRLSGNPNTPRVWLTSGLWISTASITSLEFLSLNAANFVTGTRFSLYGIRG